MSDIVYPCYPHQNGNMFAGIDLETTGTDPERHAIIQIAIVPMTPDFKPWEEVSPFYYEVAPYLMDERGIWYEADVEPMAIRTNDLDVEHLIATACRPDVMVDMLIDWFDALPLAFERRLIPIAHNWQFEATFLKRFLGIELFDKMFLANCRDSMAAANFINDKAASQGHKPPFERVNLHWLCQHYKIQNMSPHDAFADTVAGAELYAKLMKEEILL